MRERLLVRAAKVQRRKRRETERRGRRAWRMGSGMRRVSNEQWIK